MKKLKTPLEATIYPEYTGNDIFFKTLQTKQEIDFAHNLILLSRKNGNSWLERITSHSYFNDCISHGAKFEDSHFLCFDKLEKVGYLENIEGCNVYNITEKFMIEAPIVKHEHPSAH
ncbi:MAG: hypothetical protein RL687_280 [Candidatus Parcubacteria bacterium]